MTRSPGPSWLLAFALVGGCAFFGRGGTVLDDDPTPTGPTADSAEPDLCGNGIIDEGEVCDGDALGTFTCADVDRFVAGDLACASCQLDTSGCVDASTWIETARQAELGKVSLPIAKALVSNVRPQIGSDPAGFFIQAEMAGPALFVSVDPASLDPVPVPGDVVSFTILELESLFDLRHASEVEAFSVDGNESNVSFLLQNLTASNSVVSELDALESEFVSFEATLLTGFSFSGAGNVEAQLATSGYPKGDVELLLRMGADFADELDLAPGCAFSFQGNMWRFRGEAQPSPYTTEAIEIESCPAPRVTGARSTGPNTVVVDLDRRLEPTTVSASDIAFDNGLTVTEVAVAERSITVTTSPQAAISYIVTVSNVEDTVGGDLDPTAATATFSGTAAP